MSQLTLKLSRQRPISHCFTISIDGDITLVFVPGSSLRSTEEGKLVYVPGKDGSQLPPVYPSIPEIVVSRIDVELQRYV